MSRIEWILDRPSTLEEVDARGCAVLGTAAWERLRYHGGLHVDRGRVGMYRRPASFPAGARVVAFAFEHEPEPVVLPTVLRDAADIVAIDKASGVPTQPTRASERLCLENAVAELLGLPKIRAVHRLDAGTSGVVLFARTQRAARALTRQFVAQRVDKSYLALCSPPPERERFDVEGWIVQVHHPSHAFFALRADAVPGGRFSASSFEVLAVRGDRALVRATPATGRTHQLRVHLAAAGSAILGDGLYAPAAVAAAAPRLMLHAHRITYRERETPVTVTAPLCDEAWPEGAGECVR